MKITTNGNLINPFPKADFVDFSLGDEWYLPQHLPLLKNLTRNPNLQWDFSSKTIEERAMYREIYRSSWVGDLGLLFYRKVNGLWSGFIDDVWVKHRVMELIPKEEIEQFEKDLRIIWGAQAKAWNIIELEEIRKKGVNISAATLSTST